MARSVGVLLSEPDATLLMRHLDAVLKANETMNLTSIRGRREAVVKHVVDSLAVAPFLAPEEELTDLGSGAGYPGVPLAVVTRQRTVLVESIQKKAAFLRRTASALGLEEIVEVFPGRAEQLASARPEGFSAVTVRAVSALPSLVELAAPLLCRGGRLFAMKGEPYQTEVKRAARAARLCGMEYRATEIYRLPGSDARRSILVYEKTGEPSMRLPRRAGTAQKRPLA